MTATIESLERVDDAGPILPPDGVLDTLLFSFDYDEVGKTLAVVVEWPFTDPGAQRSFIELTFCQVSQIRRIAGHRPELQEHRLHYAMNATGRAFMLVGIVRAGRHCKLDIGYEFGGLEFDHGGVTARVLHTKATREGRDKWTYRNARTGEPVEFDDPFGRARKSN